MAVFGLQIVISLVIFCFLTKLTKYYSFGRWLLCNGLFSYWPPTNEELKQAIKQRYAKESSNKSKKQSNISKSYHKSSVNNNNNNNDSSNSTEEFPVPIDTSIELKLIPLMHKDVIQVKYMDDFFSIVDFILGSIVIYLLTELYFYLIPILRQNNEHLNEINLSLFWCWISLLLALTVLTKFVREYLKVDEGILCVIFGALSFLLALCLQYIDEKIFDFNLKETYGNRTIVYNDDSDEEINYLDRRFIYFVMILSIVNAYQTIILFFPAFRFGQLQYLLLIKSKTKTKFKDICIFILTLVNFILPIFICLLWFKPITKYFNADLLLKIKILSIIVSVFLRICLFKIYIQMYLDTAFDRVKVLYEQQQSTTIRITNLSYQRNVNSVFYYLGVVTSQYILPAFIELIICFYLIVFSTRNSYLAIYSKAPPQWLQNIEHYMTNSNYTNSSLVSTWNELHNMFNYQHITVLISYLLFWHHTIFCVISCGSLIYNTYIQREQHTNVKSD